MGAMAVVLKRREPWYDLRLCAAGKGGYRGEVRQGIDQCPRARNVAAPNKLVAHLKHKGRTVMLSKVRVDTATDYADYRSLLRGIRAGHGIREGERREATKRVAVFQYGLARHARGNASRRRRDEPLP